MKTSIVWNALFIASLAACMAPEEGLELRERPEAPPSAGVPSESSVTADHAGEAEARLEAPRPVHEAPPSPRPSQVEVSTLWNDPGFRRQLTESYLAETEIEPPVGEDERDELFEALELIADEKLSEAIEVLREAIEDSPNAVFYFTLANAHLQQERFVEAAKACQEAVERYPKFRRAWRLLGQLHFGQSRFTEAIPALTRVIELGGQDGFTYGSLGIAYSNVGSHLSAETAFRRANLLQPDRIEWRIGLAESLFKQQRFPEAIALSETLIAEQPDRPELWLAQGEAYAMAGQSMKAAENFEMADRLGGATVRTLYNLADIYANEDVFDMAVDAYLRALKKDEGQRPDRAIRGATFLSQKGALVETRWLLDGIESVFGERSSDDDLADLLRLRATVVAAEDAGEEQVRILERVVQLDPLDGDALIKLGLLAAADEDPQQAILYFERAAGLPELEAEAKLRHGQLLVQQERYGEALPLLRAAHVLKPHDRVQRFIEQVEKAAANR